MTGTMEQWIGKTSALPPIAEAFQLDAVVEDDGIEAVLLSSNDDLQSISAFVCIIEYEGRARLITCKKYEQIGDLDYVGAVCHAARGYRQFRCDRITAVYDASSGEWLGSGDFFQRFEVQSRRERAPTWGLGVRERAMLVAGLNILAFMARCDGEWHPLESEPVERFACAMWLRKEWEGEPDLKQVLSHAQRLAPDSEIFFRSLQLFAGDRIASQVLRTAVADLVAADGVICGSEMSWGGEIDSFLSASAAAASSTLTIQVRAS